MCRRSHVGARRLRAAALGRRVTTAPAAQRLNGREQHIRVRRLVLASVVTEGGGGGGPKRNVRIDCARISSRWAMNSTRSASARCVSKALSQVFPRPVARTTRPAVLPAAGVALEGGQRLLLDRMRLRGGPTARGGHPPRAAAVAPCAGCTRPLNPRRCGVLADAARAPRTRIRRPGSRCRRYS